MRAELAAPLAAAVVGIASWCNRRVFGFLPDDLPRPGRKLHPRAVPLAGIALLPVLLPFLCASGLWWLAAGVVAVALLGYADDWCKEKGRDFDWRLKALVLGLSAAAAATEAADPFAAPQRWCVCWAIAFVLTNATNFLDNTDGVSAALSATSLLLATGADGPLAAAGFAALGFLPWNWPRPVVFLGDAGAYALGLCAGVASGRALPSWPAAVLPFLVQFADFVQVVTARLALGVAPWIGDRRHLTHIAQNLGLPRWSVAPLLAAIAAAAAWSVPAD
jgi:UDP-N-acetylmuramyl pentapeptide phosphotransferase/UDP-N-acetylglucosamine-1-phosphate transferase